MRLDRDWDMPEDWRGRQLPRRGGMPFEALPVDPDAPARLAALLATSDLQPARNAEYKPKDATLGALSPVAVSETLREAFRL